MIYIACGPLLDRKNARRSEHARISQRFPSAAGGTMGASRRFHARLLLLLGGGLFWVSAWVTASAAQLQLESVLGDASLSDPAGTFARADIVRPFVFPLDHGPHERFRSEWWYLTMSLENADGARFGVQFTTFRQALRAEGESGATSAGPSSLNQSWNQSGSQLYLAHMAVTDVDAKLHLEAERLSRAHPELAGARADPFRVWVDGWSLSAVEGSEGAESGGAEFSLPPLALQARADRFDVQLSLLPAKELVLQGDRGLSPKGPGQASYYYSMTRIAARGTLRVGEQTHQVTGNAWLDREWSTSLLSSRQQGWDWFGLQLDGNEELMVFQLRRKDGSRDPYDQGLWVDPNGGTKWLKAEDFDLQPLRYWRDDSGVSWPVKWRLKVRLPSGVRHYEIEAAVADQRMDTLITYWEGLVRVVDDEGTMKGSGYMELTGYE